MYFRSGRGVLVRLGMVVCGLLICMVVALTTFTTMDRSLLTELPVMFVVVEEFVHRFT